MAQNPPVGSDQNAPIRSADLRKPGLLAYTVGFSAGMGTFFAFFSTAPRVLIGQAGYSKIGFSGTKEDWEIDPHKNKARRLVAHGVKMMRGGYRLLLHYPIKPDGH